MLLLFVLICFVFFFYFFVIGYLFLGINAKPRLEECQRKEGRKGGRQAGGSESSSRGMRFPLQQSVAGRPGGQRPSNIQQGGGVGAAGLRNLPGRG